MQNVHTLGMEQYSAFLFSQGMDSRGLHLHVDGPFRKLVWSDFTKIVP